MATRSSAAVQKPAAPRASRRKTADRPAARIEYIRVEGAREFEGIDSFIKAMAVANPMQLIEAERLGVPSELVVDVSTRMGVTQYRMQQMLGIARATWTKKISKGETFAGSAGQSVLGMARLLGIAQAMAQRSTATEARGFDSAKWLGEWLDIPQPALGGAKPSALIDTPTGVDVVAKLLGAIESGAYQ
jgi:putative toxin-antitoxin system antitoxin component (TIGR02293 family)